MSLPSKINIFPSLKFRKGYASTLLLFIFCLIFPLQLEAQSIVSGLSEQSNYEALGKESYGDPYMQAEHLVHSGKFTAAKPFYHKYLEENNRGERRPKALFRLGLIDQNAKSFATALKFYKMVIFIYFLDILINSFS